MQRFFDKIIDRIAKNSFVFASMIFGCIALIIGLSLYIKTDTMFTVKVAVNDSEICLEENIDISTDYLYVYSDRNEDVYLIHIENIYQKDGRTYVVGNKEDMEKIRNLSNLIADVPIGKVSVFERIFLKGGKNK